MKINKVIIIILVFIVLIAGLSAPAVAYILNTGYTGDARNAMDTGNTSGSSVSSPTIRPANGWFSNNYRMVASPTPTNASPIPTKVSPVPTNVSPIPTKVSPVPTNVSPVPTNTSTNLTPVTASHHDSYTIGPGENLKIGDLRQPVVSKPNTTRKNIMNKTSSDDAQLKTAKSLANARINLIIRQIEVYKKEITNSRLSDDDKSILFAEADQNIAWFKEEQGEIQSADDLETVQGTMSLVDQQIDVLKVDLKKDAGLLAYDEVDVKITTAQNVSGIVSQKIANLKVQGNDTTRAEQLLADYDGHVSAASDHMDVAKARFDNITSAGNADQNFASGYGELSRSETELGKAYIDLKELYRLLLHK